ncbi:DNA mismatch repair protein MutS [Halobacteriales archaeon QS_3_64_16]|nr:MAG: DNA mismatch repair protein MutS [Halobacteriales archaeon QS_3_64_16]
MDLESIPGVGAKTAAALAELDDPERALETGDVATLASAPGIPKGRGARIARAAIRRSHDDPGTFLATDRARELYRVVLSLLQERAVTDYGQKRLETFYPSGVTSRIEEVREFAERAIAREPDPAVLDALAGVSRLSAPTDVTVRDRCLATTDAETYSAAREQVPELSVELIEDARDLAELARGYATVIALDEAFAGVDVEGDVKVVPDALENPQEIVPERTLSFFAANRDPLRAAAAVARHADLDSPCDVGALEDGLERLDSDGSVAGDAELDRLTNAAADLEDALSIAENLADDELREVIAESEVRIEGGDLLSLVERGAGVDSLLARELEAEYADAIEAARKHLVDALDLQDEEADRARRVFDDEPTYPVERDSEVVPRLRETLEAARDRRATELKRELAADLAGLRRDCESLVRDALELDVSLAISRFDRDFACTMPTFGGSGFSIEGGRSPLLDVPFEESDPIDYAVSGVTLLSGVNSGGKTSTLDLVGLCVILAHMGLPVPASEARFERVSQLYYQAKSQGTLDAGALEHTLQEFAGLATGSGSSGDDDDRREVDGGSDEEGKKLVLVDELESITEPGASAVIIAGILEALSEREATAVFVSHLAGEIREVAEFPIAVDGIEAVGLVDGELEVDRSPEKGLLARSTPELIVEKLAGETDGASDSETSDHDTDFYDRLLEKFDTRESR